MEEEFKKMIFELCNSDGVSGKETKTAKIALKYLNKYMDAYIDDMGSVIGSFNKGRGNPILLDAHLDKIGLIVTGIEDNGFLRVDKCGGVDVRVIAASDVIVHGKKNIYGVITSVPPHLTKSGEEKKAATIDNILVDTGLTKDELSKLVTLGTRISFKSQNSELQNNIISCSALDNRVGVAAIIKCIEILSKHEVSRQVDVLLSCQEETNETGAKTGSFKSEAKECLCTDVTFASCDGVPSELHGAIGKGPMICYAPSLSYEMSEKLKRIAEENNIPYQLEIVGGKSGTNADSICVTKGGISCGLVSVPQRNMHTSVETVSVEDVENTGKIMAQYILKGGD